MQLIGPGMQPAEIDRAAEHVHIDLGHKVFVGGGKAHGDRHRIPGRKCPVAVASMGADGVAAVDQSIRVGHRAGIAGKRLIGPVAPVDRPALDGIAARIRSGQSQRVRRQWIGGRGP